MWLRRLLNCGGSSRCRLYFDKAVFSGLFALVSYNDTFLEQYGGLESVVVNIGHVAFNSEYAATSYGVEKAYHVAFLYHNS